MSFNPKSTNLNTVIKACFDLYSVQLVNSYSSKNIGPIKYSYMSKKKKATGLYM